MGRASKIAGWTTVTMTLVLLVLWPMPLYGTGYVFSKKFFTGWVVVGIMWLGFSSCCVGLFPLWEGRTSMARTAKAIWRDINGTGIGRYFWEKHYVESIDQKWGLSLSPSDSAGIM